MRFLAHILLALALTCSQAVAGGFLINSYRLAAPSGGVPTYSNLGCTLAVAGATTYTFTAVDVGTAASDRLTVVGIATGDATTVYDVTSVTIGGDAATNSASSSRASSVGGADLYHLANTSGTSEDIVVTMSEATNRTAICVWAIYGLTSQTPEATNNAASASAAALTLDINVSANAVVLGMCGGQLAGTPYDWTGLTEITDTGGSISYSSAELNPSSGSTPLAITCDAAGTAADVGGVSASWR